ncbi:MAG: hypothetical protein ACRBBP_07760 [Bdellovibrionales bacterium]
MSFILKLAASIYILSVLAFSSWSRASESYEFQPSLAVNTNAFIPYGSKSSITTVDDTGVVLEENGYLLFENEAGFASLIHSNSFSLFENVELPVRVALFGQSLQKASGLNNLSPVLQVTDVIFLDL